ncbi:MAG: protease PrsW, partial [Caldilineae bacterium]
MTFLLGLLVSIAAAVIPTGLYAFAFYLADRYEREPVWLAAVAFFWGAIPAVVASVIGEILLGAPLALEPGTVGAAVVESALIAPLVEESIKGLAVYLIYRLLRREFDGVLDGLTYGALVGFGFAMTENFLYFVGAFNEGGFVDLSALILLRAVIFGLNHAFYTGLFGIGLGLARQARTDRARRLWLGLGFGAALFTHGLHNLGASLAGVNALGFLLSLGLAVLGFALILLALLLAAQQERRWLQEELAAEVGVLLSADEYRDLVQRSRR